MENLLTALIAPDRAIRDLIETYGASRRDLIDLGLKDYTARKWLRTTSPHPMTPTQTVQVSPLGLTDTVALVPMGEIGRRYLDHDVYIRDMQLHGQMRLRATHLGWSDEGTVKIVRPITRRWRIGSATAIPATGVTNPSAITTEPDLNENWPGPATLVELGDPMHVGLPLGFAPNPTGGAPAIPGVRHYLLSELIAAARTSLTLADTTTV